MPLSSGPVSPASWEYSPGGTGGGARLSCSHLAPSDSCLLAPPWSWLSSGHPSLLCRLSPTSRIKIHNYVVMLMKLPPPGQPAPQSARLELLALWNIRLICINIEQPPGTKFIQPGCIIDGALLCLFQLCSSTKSKSTIYKLLEFKTDRKSANFSQPIMYLLVLQTFLCRPPFRRTDQQKAMDEALSFFWHRF